MFRLSTNRNKVNKQNTKHSQNHPLCEKNNQIWSWNLSKLYTMEMNKVSLSAYDDKRYILDDGITSYAYGHYKTLKASL